MNKRFKLINNLSREEALNFDNINPQKAELLYKRLLKSTLHFIDEDTDREDISINTATEAINMLLSSLIGFKIIDYTDTDISLDEIKKVLANKYAKCILSLEQATKIIKEKK